MYNNNRVSFPEVKCSELNVDHPLSSAEVKERVKLYLYSPVKFTFYLPLRVLLGFYTRFCLLVSSNYARLVCLIFVFTILYQCSSHTISTIKHDNNIVYSLLQFVWHSYEYDSWGTQEDPQTKTSLCSFYHFRVSPVHCSVLKAPSNLKVRRSVKLAACFPSAARSVSCRHTHSWVLRRGQIPMATIWITCIIYRDKEQ